MFKRILRYFGYSNKEYVCKKELANTDNEINKLNTIVDKLEEKLLSYDIIYNPKGVDCWFINNKNTVYIQGKPRNLRYLRANKVFILGDKFDQEWIDKALIPFVQNRSDIQIIKI